MTNPSDDTRRLLTEYNGEKWHSLCGEPVEIDCSCGEKWIVQDMDLDRHENRQFDTPADLHAAREQITHLLEDSDGLAKLYAEADGKLAKAREALKRITTENVTTYMTAVRPEDQLRDIAQAALKEVDHEHTELRK